jgi:hypothetical protein
LNSIDEIEEEVPQKQVNVTQPIVIRAHYVLIGGGSSTNAAMEAIKKHNPHADVRKIL